MNKGFKLKMKRMEKKMSQDQLGKPIGVTGQTISLYERGKVLPRPENMKKIASILNSSVEELFFNEDEEG